MCVDLKNIETNQQASFSLSNALLTIAGIALVVALGVFCWQAAPVAIDQAFSIKPPSISKVSAQRPVDHFYHPDTHWMTLTDTDK